MSVNGMKAVGQWPESLEVHAEDLAQIISVVWAATQLLLGSKQYTGCVIQIEQMAEPSGSINLVAGTVGRHEDRLLELVGEKIGRVRQHNLSDGHLTSGQSRDPQRVQLGGAVIARRLIIGIAGLTEEANEAMALCIAQLIGALDNESAAAIAAMRQNHLFDPLRSVFNK